MKNLGRMTWYAVWCVFVAGWLFGCSNDNEYYDRKLNEGDKLETLLETRFGTLEVMRSQQDAPLDAVSLDGKPFLKRDFEYLTLYHYFVQPKRDVVLMGANCGGTGCPFDELFFIVLRDDAEPTVFADDQMYAFPNEIDALQKDGTIRVGLGYVEGKQQTAFLHKHDAAGTKLEIVLSEPLQRPLEVEYCEWLHTDAMNACAEYKDTDAKCEDPQAGFMGYLMRGVAAIADRPGFVSAAFEQACIGACKTGAAIEYTAFATEVCSHTQANSTTTTKN